MSVYQVVKIGGGKNRESSVEVLRLLSMLMVLNLHSFWGYDQCDGIAQFADFFREATSICAVDVFILISGYFSIKWKIKSFYNLLFQCAFYSFAVYFAAVGLGVVNFEIKPLLKCFGCFFASWGFITCYIVLYVLAPILNAFVERSSSKELFIFIVLLFVAANSICFTTGILNFILLYLVGRFIKKIDLVGHSDKKPWMGYIVTTIAIAIITFCLNEYTPINTAERMGSFPLGYSYNSPLIILQAVFLFLCFARMKFSNKCINWAAASCLSIFLIHMHPTIKYIGYYDYTKSLYSLPIMQHIGNLVLLMSCVFFGSILLDKIRIIISEIIYEICCKIKGYIPTIYITVDTYIPKTIKNLL